MRHTEAQHVQTVVHDIAFTFLFLRFVQTASSYGMYFQVPD